jgi:hypothetical protein
MVSLWGNSNSFLLIYFLSKHQEGIIKPPKKGLPAAALILFTENAEDNCLLQVFTNINQWNRNPGGQLPPSPAKYV